METPLLKDPDQFPTTEILQPTLGGSYAAYALLMETISQSPYELIPLWNYYKDGKAWLCKVVFRKKTVFWLSVWDQYFKVTFYFTEKNREGIASLDIADELKRSFTRNKPAGKLLPLTLSMNNKDQITDLLYILAFKKTLK